MTAMMWWAIACVFFLCVLGSSFLMKLLMMMTAMMMPGAREYIFFWSWLSCEKRHTTTWWHRAIWYPRREFFLFGFIYLCMCACLWMPLPSTSWDLFELGEGESLLTFNLDIHSRISHFSAQIDFLSVFPPMLWKSSDWVILFFCWSHINKYAASANTCAVGGTRALILV